MMHKHEEMSRDGGGWGSMGVGLEDGSLNDNEFLLPLGFRFQKNHPAPLT